MFGPRFLQNGQHGIPLNTVIGRLQSPQTSTIMLVLPSSLFVGAALHSLITALTTIEVGSVGERCASIGKCSSDCKHMVEGSVLMHFTVPPLRRLQLAANAPCDAVDDRGRLRTATPSMSTTWPMHSLAQSRSNASFTPDELALPAAPQKVMFIEPVLSFKQMQNLSVILVLPRLRALAAAAAEFLLPPPPSVVTVRFPEMPVTTPTKLTCRIPGCNSAMLILLTSCSQSVTPPIVPASVPLMPELILPPPASAFCDDAPAVATSAWLSDWLSSTFSDSNGSEEST